MFILIGPRCVRKRKRFHGRQPALMTRMIHIPLCLLPRVRHGNQGDDGGGFGQMFSVKNFARKFNNGKIESVDADREEQIEPKVSHSRKEKNLSGISGNSPRDRDETNREMTDEASVNIHPGSSRCHRSAGRKTKVHSRQGDHKCRKRSIESLLEKIDHLRNKNHALSRKIISSEVSRSIEEKLSPLEMDLDIAYKHLKSENNRLKVDLNEAREENERVKGSAVDVERENEILREDVNLMKNLVYKLNLELERYQTGERKIGDAGQPGAGEGKLPKNYEKNFLRPLLPLLRAYVEALRQKDDLIKDLDGEYRKFNVAFNEILRENERLYGELEKKFSGSTEGCSFEEVNNLKRDLEMAKHENNLLLEQINLEKEKLVKIHSTFKVKVEDAVTEKEGLKSLMEESKTELLVMRGKYAVLKQEFERVKMDNESRIPQPVHSASINECRKLFDDLKGEYESEKSRLRGKIKKLEQDLLQRDRDKEKWTEERAYLEKSNFSQAFEVETLVAKIKELEARVEAEGGGGEVGPIGNQKNRREVNGLMKRLGEANQKVSDLSRSLVTTRKKLQKAMEFAEEIVRGQETLLLQLHEKQKENNYMTAQFGNLKNQLKDVEKGAQESLNSVEEKIRNLESENHDLMVEKRRLEKLLAAREDTIRKLEPGRRDSAS